MNLRRKPPITVKSCLTVACPACNAVIRDLWEAVQEGEAQGMLCPECATNFTVLLRECPKCASDDVATSVTGGDFPAFTCAECGFTYVDEGDEELDI
jgi:transposase-like protein